MVAPEREKPRKGKHNPCTAPMRPACFALNSCAGALGVRCQFCHVDGDFTSDMKPEKVTARKMIAMMNAINKDNFNARQAVTCYTCHNGHNDPANVAALPTVEDLIEAVKGPPRCIR